MAKTAHISTALLAIALVATACGSGEERDLDPSATYESFGVPFEPAGAVPAQAVVADAAGYSGRSVMVEGVLLNGCDPGSCWMTMSAGGENVIRVYLEDADADPEAVSRRRAVVHGVLSAVADSFDLQATGVMVEKVRT